MNIRDLVPVDVPPNMSGLVFDELASFLADYAADGYTDTRAGPAAVRIIVAFAALEREGTFQAFRDELRKFRLRRT